jgi:uncharacterized protein YbcI
MHLASSAVRRLSLFPTPDLQSPGKGEIGWPMATPSDQQHTRDGLYVALSNAIVKLLRENTGRGPTKARTTIRDNIVVIMLEQTLTKGEQNLVRKQRADKVIEIRHEFQEAMREEASAMISELTGRKVLAFMSANHLEPDMAAEIFVLDGAPDHGRERAQAPGEQQP